MVLRINYASPLIGAAVQSRTVRRERLTYALLVVLPLRRRKKTRYETFTDTRAVRLGHRVLDARSRSAESHAVSELRAGERRRRRLGRCRRGSVGRKNNPSTARRVAGSRLSPISLGCGIDGELDGPRGADRL
jgi:hypothetical protein